MKKLFEKKNAKKLVILVIIIIAIICGLGFLWRFITGPDRHESLIGGQRDEYGCLGPAGYSYDESVGACTRSWEMTDDKRRAAKTVVDDITDDLGPYGLTVVEMTETGDEGGFDMRLERINNGVSKLFDIKIKNWVVEQIDEVNP